MEKEIEKLSEFLYNSMRTEMISSKIMGLPNDDYKEGFNQAMEKALKILKNYKEGNGLFQM